MSYILDALNKSDQERRANETPTLDTHHHQPVQVKSRPSWVVWVIILLVLVTIGNLGMFWFSQSETEEVTAPVKLVPEATPEAEIKVQTQITPVVIQVTPKAEARPPAIARPAGAPISIGGLPTNIRSELPSLIFTSHMYADDKDLRLVNINGTMMVEGDLIARGLKLADITEDGVIIHYKGYAIEMGVLQDWISE